MDRALEEVIGERQRGNQGGRDRRRNDWPHDGVGKNGRAASNNLDDEWLHDKYKSDDDDSHRPLRGPRGGRGIRERDAPEADLVSRDAKLRVENLHWDLTEDDLEELFTRIAPVVRLSMDYDRAGRSKGTAYVTYKSVASAREAIREFDGANAKGQPIRLSLVPSGPARSRNPFDTAVNPVRSLFDRIEDPRGRAGNSRSRNRSRSPRRTNVDKPPPEGTDRYVPDGGRPGRSRSPARRRGNARRLGSGRREEGRQRRDEGGNKSGGRSTTLQGRPRATQEELDREMDEYWNKKAGANGASATPPKTGTAAPAAAPPMATAIDDGDIDMMI